MKILMISFSNRDQDGRLQELIKVCNLIGKSIVISQTDLKAEQGNDSCTYLRHRRFNYLHFIMFCIKTAKSIKKADLVFADNRAAIIPALICKTLVRACYTVYDARELYILKEVTHFRGKIGCIIENLYLRKFSLLICANSFRAEIMKKLYKLKVTPLIFENIRRLEPDNNAQEVNITSNYYNSEETTILNNGSNEESLFEKRIVNIISTSGCRLERKCDVLARAVCELGDGFKLYLVGIPDVNGRKAVDKIEKQYKADNIVCIDYLSKPELKKLIGQCDIGIVSYTCDSTNNKYCASGKIYEYLFEGLPVVTTSNPPLKAMCGEHGIGLSDDGFKSGIKAVSENLEFYKDNVKAFISTVDVDVNNNKLAYEIGQSLGIKTETHEPESLNPTDNRLRNKALNSFLFITAGYPTEGKQLYTFLDALICEIADLGKNCTVIYPISLTHFLIHREKLPPKDWTRITDNGTKIRVLCPRIITFSNGRLLRSIRSLWNYSMFRRKVYQTIRKNNLQLDVVYGHFIQPSGFVAAEIGKVYTVPSCVAYGENTTYNIDVFGLDKSRRLIRDITACISVSSDNTQFLIENGIILEKKIATIPNAVNRGVFYPRDKTLMREKYNIPQDSFVVSFVGYFTEIKGSLRLSEALDKITNVQSIFIGKGALKPTCKDIVFVGSVLHDQIPELLSASDIFVLPTIAEGCCNAIIEALSCGLPVISSNLSFNDDILNDNCSLRIDTTDIDKIAEAICKLRDNSELRRKMSEAAIKTTEQFDIKVRAERIIEWIRHCSESPIDAATEADL